jgi:hypothetical protein
MIPQSAPRWMAAALLGLAASGCVDPVDAPPPPSFGAEQGCLPWVNFPRDVHSNAESPDLGCANRANLEMLVVRPSDLDAGRPLGPANGEHESRAVTTYQAGKIKDFDNAPVAAPTIVMPGGSGGAQ